MRFLFTLVVIGASMSLPQFSGMPAGSTMGFASQFGLSGAAAAPPPTYHHEDTENTQNARGAHLNSQSAQASQASRFKALEAQSATASDAIFAALRAKSKGNSTSKGAKLSKSEMQAETWDDTKNWDDEVEAVESARAEASGQKVKAIDTGDKQEGSVKQVEAGTYEAEQEQRTHHEDINQPSN